MKTLKILNKIFGFVEFDIIGGIARNFLNDCVKNEVPLQKLHVNDLGYTAGVPLRYYKKLHKIARRSRCRLRVRKKRGLYFALFPFRRRLGLLIGVLALLITLNIFPQMVWTVQFYEFTYEEQEFLRQQLYDFGIQEGATVDTHELKTVQYDLFLDNNSYGWIKLNFVKGKLIVEKIDAVLPPEPQSEEPAAIVALCDGIIQRLEVEGGFIEKTEGQSVAKGDVIVSALKIGTYDKLHTERAIAKVYASVERTYEITQPLNITAQIPSIDENEEKSIIVLGGEIKFPNFNKHAENEMQIVEYKPLAIFGLPLPATIKTVKYREITNENIIYTEEQAQNIARDKIYTQIYEDLPECEIISANESVEITENSIILRIEFDAIANIAIVQEGWNK